MAWSSNLKPQRLAKKPARKETIYATQPQK